MASAMVWASSLAAKPAALISVQRISRPERQFPAHRQPCHCSANRIHIHQADPARRGLNLLHRSSVGANHDHSPISGPSMVGARDKRFDFLLRQAVSYLLRQELDFRRGWIT